VSSFNGLKYVINNKKCKSLDLPRPYENQGLKKKYRSGVHALKNPNFTLTKDSRKGFDY
jgi:hypothetical protein